MPSSSRDEIIFGFTEKEVKFLLISLKCVETHGNRRFLNCARLAENTGYSPAYAYEYYMSHLRQKIIDLPPIDLTDGSDDQKDADTAMAGALQVPKPAAEKDGKTGSRGSQNEKKEMSCR
ncbi:hypothetical protein UCDDA912_g04235 [Diaporthe ampelina]|uniref:Uncharacterized protein n=1 Tax=Diaporthe ampelina TaxID=1214573 RepID=A0A0G2I7E2_9PEZI|nr:hypothetical protein UCDDA912_g04235 [Diaporthe ampelina]